MLKILEYNPGTDSISESSLAHIQFECTKVIYSLDPGPDEMKELSQRLLIPLDVLEKGYDERQRSTVQEIEHYSHIIFRTPVRRERQVHTFSFSAFVSKNLILFCAKHDFAGMENFLKLHYDLKKDLLKKGTTAVLLRVLEEIIDDYFYIMDEIENHINEFEDQVFSLHRGKTTKILFKLKMSLIYLHKSLIANRDMVIGIEKGIVRNFDQSRSIDFRFLYNDLVQLIDMVTTNRDILSGALEIYLSAVSNNLNATIKKMTAWGSLVLIPTFIASLYGMNFKHMPEIGWTYGYLWALGLMVVSVGLLYYYFKKNNYF
ncbi:MAG: magnesium transporter CorA family protein [Nanoarchaeota archaeon]